MKTAEKIKKGLEHCRKNAPCMECEYYDLRDRKYACETALMTDAIACIQQLESQVSKWISVDNPPKKGGRYLILFEDGHCCDAEFDECIDFDSQFGERVEIYHPETLGYLDSEWRGYQEVTHWMELPEPPKEG